MYMNINLNKSTDYHIHTNYCDHCNMSIPSIISRAEELGLTEIAITEHVRKTSTWTTKYLREIRGEKKRTDISVLAGFETKVLNEKGKLDIRKKLLKKYFIIGSFHTFRGDYKKALINLIKNPHVDVLGHLGTQYNGIEVKYIGENYLSDIELERIACLIEENNKIVEINAKHRLPYERFLQVFKQHSIQFILGSDAHSIEEIGNYRNIRDLIELVR